MNIPFDLIFVILISYVVGSLPTAVIVSKLFFGFDIRSKGSGNMGSTNAFRVLGWKWGLFVQVLDIAKGIFAVLFIAIHFGDQITASHAWISDVKILQIIAGIAAVCGHIWSLFVNFKGGKGVNTAAGMMIGLAPVDFGVALLLFVVAVMMSGYISLGSIIAAVAIPASLLIRSNLLHVSIPGYGTMIYFALAIMILVIYTHRTNIKRLLKGSENKFHKLHLIKLKGKTQN